MVYIVAALVLVAAVTVLNLLFTLGVIRRLREHTELIALGGAGHSDGALEGVLAAGETVGGFTATSVDGHRVDQDGFAEGAMVGFFSPNCGPCRERLPEFVALAGAVPAEQRQVFAVVIGDEDATTEMVTRLRGVATVVTGTAAEPMAEAFGTTAYPALYRMAAGGVVAASGHSMAVYPVLAAA
jgi:thiol-disulfide isomerase/thioredoxin